MYGAKMIQVSGPLIWNIPDVIQKVCTIFTFKKQQKEQIFDQYVGEGNGTESYTNHNSTPD